MKQVTQKNRTGEIRIEEVPLPALKPGFVLVRTRYSVISAGTEKASITERESSLLEKARKNPDLVRKVIEQIREYGLFQTFRRVQRRFEERAPLGYSVSGTVVAVGEGVKEFIPGDNVACAGAGYANHAEYVVIPRNLCAKVPSRVELEEASYTTLGAIALQGVRQAEPTLGETVVVIGLGLVGQLTVQLLKANGCVAVGIDTDPFVVKLARQNGADLALERNTDDVKKVVQWYTKNIGADAVIITAATSANDPVELAGDLCREKGRVILVGDVGLQLPRAAYFRKELDFRLSRSYGPGRYDPVYEEAGNDYPLPYVRWSENRNMQEFLRLVSEKKVNVHRLTSHRFRLEDVRSAYDLIMGRASARDRYVGVVLDYGDPKLDVKEKPIATIQLSSRGALASSKSLNIGFVGAGSFAQGFLLPHIEKFRKATLVGVCTGNGLNATNVGKMFQFQFATTDASQIFSHPEIGTVFIAARHNLHAPFVLQALRAGKNVFVEKPLSLRPDELRDIVKTYDKAQKDDGGPLLLVGFNRRFAPHVQHIKRLFETSVGPWMVQYRVNAGFVPRTHWTQDPAEGGGRIIGEMCHFVDLIQYLTNSVPVKVSAEPMASNIAGSSDDDSVTVTIKMENGSVGTIAYVANGDPAMPKEYIEVSSTGRSAILENFRTLTLYQQGKRRVFKLSTIDKGHRDEVRSFLTALNEAKGSPIPFSSVVTTTVTTFKIVESIRTGVSVSL